METNYHCIVLAKILYTHNIDLLMILIVRELIYVFAYVCIRATQVEQRSWDFKYLVSGSGMLEWTSGLETVALRS